MLPRPMLKFYSRSLKINVILEISLSWEISYSLNLRKSMKAWILKNRFKKACKASRRFESKNWWA